MLVFLTLLCAILHCNSNSLLFPLHIKNLIIIKMMMMMVYMVYNSVHITYCFFKRPRFACALRFALRCCVNETRLRRRKMKRFCIRLDVNVNVHERGRKRTREPISYPYYSHHHYKLVLHTVLL